MHEVDYIYMQPSCIFISILLSNSQPAFVPPQGAIVLFVALASYSKELSHNLKSLSAMQLLICNDHRGILKYRIH